jgi:hypothetical protein
LIRIKYCKRIGGTGGILVVVLCSGNGLVNYLQDIIANHVALAKDTHGCAIAVENISIGSELLKLNLGKLHEAFHLIFGTVKVFNAKCIYGDDLDATLVTDFHYLRGGLAEMIEAAAAHSYVKD